MVRQFHGQVARELEKTEAVLAELEGRVDALREKNALLDERNRLLVSTRFSPWRAVSAIRAVTHTAATCCTTKRHCLASMLCIAAHASTPLTLHTRARACLLMFCLRPSCRQM